MSWGLNSTSTVTESTAHEEFSFYQPPENTAGSMRIPVATSAQPVAFVSVKVKKDSLVALRAAIGWKAPEKDAGENRIVVVFEIWRETPLTSTLICSITDSSTAGTVNYKATSFEHVDTGVPDSSSDLVTYTLAARQLNQTGIPAEIIGCLTFTALCIRSRKKT